MIETITKQIQAFLSTWQTIYNRQAQTGRILIPAVVVLVFCCLCSVTISLIARREASSGGPLPPNPLPTDGTLPTNTPLFSFDLPTFTPFPSSTFFVPTPFPTLTPLPTGSPTPTSAVPTETATPLPTVTQAPPTATATSSSSVVIIAVDKRAEYAEIQNVSPAAVNLRGWRLVSETGNQSCSLRGTLDPNEVLRIWARRGSPGFDCRFSDYIWRNDVPDPAVLYNAQGEEVSRFP